MSSMGTVSRCKRPHQAQGLEQEHGFDEEQRFDQV